MRIRIRKRGRNTAILMSFDTDSDKFESRTERNRFFSELHGRKQIITKNSGRYVYHREGLLTEIPHIKVDTSVFIIAMEHMKRMLQFFKEWEDKVELKTFPVLLDKTKLKKLEREIE